jgi:tetratricopeptide (TPR) repeat protein
MIIRERFQLRHVLRGKQGSFGRRVTVYHCLVILCLITLITLIALNLLPYASVWAKVEKDVASGNLTGLYDKGVALDREGNHTGAMEYYDRALAIDPKNVLTLTYKGIALDREGNHTGAIVYFDKAISIDQKYLSS